MMTGTQLHFAMELAWRVGEMPTERCEHSQHDTHPQWHEDGREHYVKTVVPCGHYGQVKVVCEKWLNTIELLTCDICGGVYDGPSVVVDFGLVSDLNQVP